MIGPTLNVVKALREYDRTTRCCPILVQATNPEGEFIQCWMKVSARSDQGHLAFLQEALTAHLAKQSGIRAAIPHPLNLSPALIDSQKAAPWYGSLIASTGLQYGSQEITGGNTEIASMELRDKDQVRESLLIVILDTILQNGDRTQLNPNLLRTREGVHIFDNELAFSFLTGAASDFSNVRVPGRNEDINYFRQFIRRHSLFPKLLGKKLDSGLVVEFLESLNGQELALAAASLPSEWVDEERLLLITSYLDQVNFAATSIAHQLMHTFADS